MLFNILWKNWNISDKILVEFNIYFEAISKLIITDEYFSICIEVIL